MKIEPLSVLHAEILRVIHEECFDEHWSVKAFQDLLGLRASFGYLTSVNEEPTGFILCQGDEQEAEVITIATRPEDRKSGVGRALVDKACGATQRMFLEVARDNPGALAFYIRMGFEQVAVRKNYYKRADATKVDALVMQKICPSPDG